MLSSDAGNTDTCRSVAEHAEQPFILRVLLYFAFSQVFLVLLILLFCVVSETRDTCTLVCIMRKEIKAGANTGFITRWYSRDLEEGEYSGESGSEKGLYNAAKGVFRCQASFTMRLCKLKML